MRPEVSRHFNMLLDICLLWINGPITTADSSKKTRSLHKYLKKYNELTCPHHCCHARPIYSLKMLRCTEYWYRDKAQCT